MTEFLFDQAHAYFLAGAYEQAETLYRQVLLADPAHPYAHNNLGIILASRGSTEEAVEHYRQALLADPDCAPAYNCLGNALFRLGQAEEAVTNFAQAIRLDPYFAEAHNGLGGALVAQGRVAEAIDSFSQAANMRPTYAEAHFNRGIAYLLLGDYERGWPGYEWRWGMRDFVLENIEGVVSWPEYESRWLSGQVVPPFSQPRWDGRPLAGRTILLFAEQGLGDTIQFIRYAPLVKERGGTVIVQCQPTLHAILAGCAGIDVLVPSGTQLPAFDVQMPFGSLPGIFGTTLSTIPASTPYLRADANLVEYWRQQLPREPRFRVGIVWQGSPRFQGDLLRSIPLTEFAPLANPEVQLISLQKGHGHQQLENLQHSFPVLDLEGRLDETSGPFMDTAAIMHNLDLVITPNTAVAHLAGALGVAVWIALPSNPEWRWLLDRSDSPWYPTARLFRQQRPGDWSGVFAQIAMELRNEVTLRAQSFRPHR